MRQISIEWRIHEHSAHAGHLACIPFGDISVERSVAKHRFHDGHGVDVSGRNVSIERKVIEQTMHVRIEVTGLSVFPHMTCN